jgi:hypothetical protein
MKTHSAITVILICTLCRPPAARAQESTARQPDEAVVRSYMAASGDHSALYNGKEEPAYIPAFRQKGHPYYVSPDFRRSELRYNRTAYTGVAMRYDMLNDELIVRPEQRAFNLIMDRAKVQEARLHDARLVPWTAAEWTGVPPCNYLFLLHDGRYPLVKKYTVTRSEQVTLEGVEVSYLYGERFYIRVAGVCRPVGSKNSLLKLFPGDKKTLNARAKALRANFDRKRREASLIQMIEYLETLHK